MITPEYCQVMSRYNLWQNKSLYRETDVLTDAERHADRGAFFGSVQRTLAHILWGDTMWMSRFDGWAAAEGGIKNSDEMITNWDEMKSARRAADKKICDWAGRLDHDSLSGELSWYSGAIKAEMCKPVSLLVTQFFNHQTHHRGQVHAMLTAAGRTPDATDLPFMPDGI